MNVLIVGYGSIAKKHINALNAIADNFTIYALRRKKENLENITEITSLTEINSKLDFAIISNPTALHFETIKSLVHLSIPLFIEKPVINNLENAKELLDILDNHKTYIACNLRFHPCINYFKTELLPNINKINEVNFYCGSYLPDWRPNQNYKKSYSANEDMGGGVHIDLIHEFDLMYYLFGTVERVSAVRSSNSHLKINASDYANYLFKANDYFVSIILNYYRFDFKRTIEILTDSDTYTIDIKSSEIKNKNNEVIFKSNEEMVQTYTHQLNYFINSIKNNTLLMNDVNEALNVLKLCVQN